jgi:hypothetical protein
MGNIKHRNLVVLGAVLLIMAAAPPALAQNWNKTPSAMVASLVEVPGAVLPEYSYTFGRGDSNSDRRLVTIDDQTPGILALPRATVPDYRNTFPARQSFRFEQPIAPNSPAAKRFPLASRMGEGYFYLTPHHQKFFVPVEQPPTSLQEWHDKVTAH